ncbi:MAG: hypothetical protein ACP5JS_05815 [Fervidobacterium sp.]
MKGLLNFELSSIEKSYQVYEKIKEGNFIDILEVIDYSKEYDNVLPNETLKLVFEDGTVLVRPSGTEPKMKVYVMVRSEAREIAQEKLNTLSEKMIKIVKKLTNEN